MLAIVNGSSCLAETFQVTGWLFMSYHCYAPVLRHQSSGSDVHAKSWVKHPQRKERHFTDKNKNTVIMPEPGHVECVSVLALSCACV